MVARIAAVVTLLLLPGASAGAALDPPLPKTDAAAPLSACSLPFVPNRGQADPSVADYA